jgi:hypothetical protein
MAGDHKFDRPARDLTEKSEFPGNSLGFALRNSIIDAKLYGAGTDRVIGDVKRAMGAGG